MSHEIIIIFEFLSNNYYSKTMSSAMLQGEFRSEMPERLLDLLILLGINTTTPRTRSSTLLLARVALLLLVVKPRLLVLSFYREVLCNTVDDVCSVLYSYSR
jgi:voltage-gated potassium channel Kch